MQRQELKTGLSRNEQEARCLRLFGLIPHVEYDKIDHTTRTFRPRAPYCVVFLLIKNVVRMPGHQLCSRPVDDPEQDLSLPTRFCLVRTAELARSMSFLCCR